MSAIAVRAKALGIALSQVGICEVGGRNCGPEVERYLGAAGLGPGHPWCAAFIMWCYREGALRATGPFELRLPITGSCARLWRRSNPLWKSDQPSVGAIYIHLEDPKDPNSKGHCGIVTAFTGRTISAVEGNTTRAGSREGDRVLLNLRRRDYVNAGYIDIGREGPVVDFSDA